MCGGTGKKEAALKALREKKYAELRTKSEAVARQKAASQDKLLQDAPSNLVLAKAAERDAAKPAPLPPPPVLDAAALKQKRAVLDAAKPAAPPPPPVIDYAALKEKRAKLDAKTADVPVESPAEKAARLRAEDLERKAAREKMQADNLAALKEKRAKLDAEKAAK